MEGASPTLTSSSKQIMTSYCVIKRLKQFAVDGYPSKLSLAHIPPLNLFTSTIKLQAFISTKKLVSTPAYYYQSSLYQWTPCHQPQQLHFKVPFNIQSTNNVVSKWNQIAIFKNANKLHKSNWKAVKIDRNSLHWIDRNFDRNLIT